MDKIKYFLFVAITFFIAACSTTKYLKSGQKLYTGAEVKFADKKNTSKREASALKAELAALSRPVPNTTILGLRYKLWIYDKTKTQKRHGLKHYLNTHFGEPPVLASSIDLVKNSSNMLHRLQNKSYFLAEIVGDTVSKKGSMGIEAVYTVRTGPAYHYRKIVFPQANDDLDTAIRGTSKRSLLKVGDKYNLDVILNERIRIDARSKEEGFFYFAPEDLIMKVDSTIADHQVDLFVKVKTSTPEEASWIYKIRNIYVYPNYTLRDTSHKLDSALNYHWYNVIDTKHTVPPSLFKNAVLLHPGDIYNRRLHTYSLKRFVNLGPFSYVKNEFEDVTPDSAFLDVYYFLTQSPRKSLAAQITARQTSANYEGAQFDVTFTNKNTFKGGERFSLKFFVSTDKQFGSYHNGYDVYQFGVKPALSWPRLISPVAFKTDPAYIPHTVLTTSYTYVDRSKLYTLNSFSASFGYDWKPAAHRQNTLNLIDLNYVNSAQVSQLYLDSIHDTQNPTLKHVINNQLTFGPNYSFVYDNTTDGYRTNTFYYMGRASESAGILGLITRADTLAGKARSVFGSNFNQYIKLENEIRFFHRLGQGSKLATRLLVGVGLPYGNSTILPYSQQFFIGGPNSLRGFQARSIGPGAYYPPARVTGGSQFLPDESGDIKIEANIEYRPHLFSIVEGALFADAGNIWNLKPQYLLPGAAFGKNFLKQMDVDVGFGLRFNLSLLILRTDFGFPVWEASSAAHGIIDGVDFREARYRGSNVVFNLAIGYPF
ncbi:BamA/TamA family outer membrane protein [Mucilaginibacter litoreus]|uniref:BamA/TamA family outer membrane protein n=1 Tax=Mucilaginibacter litoreus TaxID=1048221 RepID=A0ABW3AYI1_9SPHI